LGRDPGGEDAQPGPAVLVGQGNPGGHLVDIDLGVVAVPLGEGPAQGLGNAGADGRLAAAGDAHHNQMLSCRGHQRLMLRAVSQSIRARSTPEATKVRWMMTIQRSCVGSKGISGLTSPISMKRLSRLMPEIATIEAISFSLRPEKSTVPIQCGRSWSADMSSLETKFS